MKKWKDQEVAMKTRERCFEHTSIASKRSRSRNSRRDGRRESAEMRIVSRLIWAGNMSMEGRRSFILQSNRCIRFGPCSVCRPHRFVHDAHTLTHILGISHAYHACLYLDFYHGTGGTVFSEPSSCSLSPVPSLSNKTPQRSW